MTGHADKSEPSIETSCSYALPNSWGQAKERLESLQHSCDLTTLSWLDFIKSGDDCLEIGPGAGSIAELVSSKIKPKGHLDLLDVSDQFLPGIASKLGNVKAIHADILEYDLGVNRYDVIYMRAVLCHLAGTDYQQLINRFTDALKIGGTLFIQDILDLDYLDYLPEVSDELKTFLHQLGTDAAKKRMDFDIGFQLPGLMGTSG